MHRISGALVVAALALSGLACDVLTNDESGPSNASFVIDGDATVSAHVLSSTAFLASPAPTGDSAQVSLVDADTVVNSLPYEAQYDISEFQRFLVQVTKADTTDAQLRLRVWIDGRQLYVGETNASDPVLRFIYMYNKSRGDEAILF